MDPRPAFQSMKVLAFALWLGVLWGPGCSCGSMAGDEGPLPYVRCARADVEARTWTVSGLSFEVSERTLSVAGKAPLRVAAFEGPVGAPLRREDVARLSAEKPDLAIYMGGLGDDEAMAEASLDALSPAPFPVLFLPGGADRWPVVQAAFDGLDDEARKRRISLAGIHRLSLPGTEWAVVSGAPLGRYAVDDDACGFGPADVEEVGRSFEMPVPQGIERRLLSWAAPSGWGLSAGFGRLEVGSLDVHILSKAIEAEGGLFAYPRGEGSGVAHGQGGAPRWVVPRLGPGGSISAEGAFREPGVALLLLGQ